MNITEDILPINPYSRPGKIRKATKGIVMHWVGNPETSAAFNKRFFASLSKQRPSTKEERSRARYASAHYIIDISGDVLRCLPDDEVAYHCGAWKYQSGVSKYFGTYYTSVLTPNFCTLGIELCHPTWDGWFTSNTIYSAVELVSSLCLKYGIGADDLYRHYDITGKECPKYWVKHTSDWVDFKELVRGKLKV